MDATTPRRWAAAMAIVAGVGAGGSLAATGGAHAAPVGAAAPAFIVHDQNGAAVDLSDFLGTGVILDFCTVWCAACQTFYATDYPSMPGTELILPMLMETSTGTASTQSVAQAWASLFGVPRVAHVGGDETLKTDILDAYLADLGAIAFPTFVFIDANLNVVGNIVGVRSRTDAEWASFVARIEASGTQVPEPAALSLLGLGLVAGWVASRRPRG